MPAWAQDDPRTYWAASDDHERSNGRLYREVQFALPNELSPEARRDLARSFAEQLTAGEGREAAVYASPSTRASRRKPDKPDNPHAHLMFSERANDGIERSPEQWFKRHNPKSPEHGGAKKSRAAVPKEWLEQTRQGVGAAGETRRLKQAGREERIDGRSLADARDAAYEAGDRARAAELSREPNVHLDPLAVKKELRAAVAGEPPDDAGVQRSYDVKDRNRALARERAEPDEQHEAEQKSGLVVGARARPHREGDPRGPRVHRAGDGAGAGTRAGAVTGGLWIVTMEGAANGRSDRYGGGGPRAAGERYRPPPSKIKAARDEVRGAAVDVRRAAEEFDMREFKLRQSYEKLDKAINSEAQNFSRWAFFKMGVLAGCVRRGRGGVVFLFSPSSACVRRWYGWDFDDHSRTGARRRNRNCAARRCARRTRSRWSALR